MGCCEVHLKTGRGKGHDCVSTASPLKKTSRKCSVHTTKPLEYICVTCDPTVLLCMTCEFDDSHRDKGHKVISIDKFVADQKEAKLLACNEAEEL